MVPFRSAIRAQRQESGQIRAASGHSSVTVAISVSTEEQSTLEPDQAELWRAQINGWLECIGRSNDRKAFRMLFTEFAPRIKAYAIRQGMLELADELVQEVMLNIWRRAAQFDSTRAGGPTWIFAVARNARIDLLRKQGRHGAEVHVETDYLWELPGSDEPTGVHQLAVARRKVRDSLRILPQEQQEIIAKVYLEDKSHQAVSEELSLPLGTVKSRVRLALQKLNAVLQEDLL